MVLEGDIERQFRVRTHRIDGAQPIPAGVIGEYAMTDHVHQHLRRAIRRNVSQPVIEVLLALAAKLLKVIEKEASEKADADADFQDVNVRLKLVRFFSFHKTRKEHLRGIV